jgi:hypothetical protein
MLAASIAARADARWLATEWGMSPEQVAAAMAGQAPLSHGSRRVRLGGKRIGNAGSYRSGDAQFRAIYYYDARGLAHIALNRISGSCRRIHANLAAEHGPPLLVSDQLILRLFIWHDRARENRIRLMVSASLCDLNYERLSDYEAIDTRAAPRR